MLRQFLQEETGATAIEYGLIAALLSVMVAGSVAALGGEYETMYANIETAVVQASAPATP